MGKINKLLRYQEIVSDLLEALEWFEWTSAPGGETYCPWCLGLKPNHRNDCMRQQAIAKAKDEEA